MQDRSIPDQQAYVEKWAKENGYTIARWYVDDAISGTSVRGRDDFEQMIADAEAGSDFGTVLCYDISRFSRGGTNETGYYLHRLRLAGVEAIFVAEGIPEGDEGELIQGVKSWQARQYSVKLARDCIRGSVSSVKAKRSSQGGQPPYGYDRQHQTATGQVLRTLRWLPDGRKREFDATGKLVRVLAADENPGKTKSDIVRLVPGDKDHIATVKRIFEMYLQGLGVWMIAATFNTEGVPSPKGKNWNAQQVKHILGNPAYCGTVAWNRRQTGSIFRVTGDGQHVARKTAGKTWNAEADWITAENVHDPIISAETYAKVREERLRRRPMGGLAKSTNRYMLSGLIRCGNCKTNFYGWTRKLSKGRTQQYYVDGAYHRKGKAVCQSSSIPAPPLNAWVLEKIRLTLLGDEKGRSVAISVFVKSVLARQKGGSEVARLEKEIEDIGKRVKSLATMLTDTALDDVPELQQTFVDLRNKRKAAETRLAQLRTSSEKRLAATDLRQWAQEQFDAMEKALNSKPGTVQLCNAIAAYIDHIVIDPATKTGILYMPPDPLTCLEKALSSWVKRSEETAKNTKKLVDQGNDEAEFD
ncbi:MAG: recombinase family protein [Phycisphaerales bacterium]|nr:recombinase family protein [Phycisphaerales bacterium]